MSVMSSANPSVTVVYDRHMSAYRFSDNHPMNPERMRMTADLLEQLDVMEQLGGRFSSSYSASDDELFQIHTPEYVAAVKRAREGHADEAFGLGTEDNPIFPDIHDAAARLYGASLMGAALVLGDAGVPVVNFGGGMHHAHSGNASGFCIYNDAAAAILRLLSSGVKKVMYIDVDAHHGDGVQDIFYDDPRVMTVSLHESGRSLFPGTGFPNETGGPNAPNSAVNVALPAGIRDNGWLRAFTAIVPAVARAFEPEVIVSQHGCDGHELDPLTNLRLSIDGQRQTAIEIAYLAQELTENRWLATGGGGYDIARTVPRAWTHLVAVAAGKPLDVETPVPQKFRDYISERYGVDAPEKMGDEAELWWRGWEMGYDPADPVDRAIMATRKEAFPGLGLDPWFD
nr:acetoin utilization protein AcuC [Pseudoglutamicibacter cumminsii]